MPFKCCMNNERNEILSEQELIPSKIPRIMNLNEGYCNNLEMIIFNGRSKANQLNKFNLDLNPNNYSPNSRAKEILPITVLETKISNFVNSDYGPSLAQACSSVAISGCNSPINIITTIETPKKIEKTGPNILPPSINNFEKLDNAFIKPDNDINLEKQLLLVSEDSQVENKDNETEDKCCDLKNNNIKELCEKNQERVIFREEIKETNEKCYSEFQYEMGNCRDSCLTLKKNDTQIQTQHSDNTLEKIVSFFNLIENKKFNEKKPFQNLSLNDNSNEMSVPKTLNHGDELELFKKPKYEENFSKKKKKKTKKSIHIEITFSPKNNNNVIIDAKKKKDITKNKNISPFNNINSELGSKIDDKEKESHLKNNSFKIPKQTIEIDGEKCFKNESNLKNQLSFDLNKFNDEKDKILINTNKKLVKTEQEKLEIEKNSKLQDFSSNETSKQKIQNLENNEINLNNAENSIEITKNNSILSDNFIPFIEDAYMKFPDDSEKLENIHDSFPGEDSDFSLTYENKKPSNITLSQETLEKLNGSMPLVNSDPQMAQLFASAQLHIDEIKNDQFKSEKNNQNSNEDNPIEIINNFVKSPTQNKDEIWLTVKAIIDVYEPQIEYAKKELKKWENIGNSDNEDVKENIEYYNNLIQDLQQKLNLADQAKKIILNESNPEEIRILLDIEQKYLDEIKEKMAIKIKELGFLEEKYLNGDVEYKEKVRSTRMKIKEYEDEIRNKLIQIHKLKDLLEMNNQI